MNMLRTTLLKRSSLGKILNGTSMANEIKQGLREDIIELQKKSPRITDTPCLGFVQVGSRPDSTLYVKKKKEACEDVGINYVGRQFHEDDKEADVKNYIRRLQADPSVNGILV